MIATLIPATHLNGPFKAIMESLFYLCAPDLCCQAVFTHSPGRMGKQFFRRVLVYCPTIYADVGGHNETSFKMCRGCLDREQLTINKPRFSPGTIKTTSTLRFVFCQAPPITGLIKSTPWLRCKVDYACCLPMLAHTLLAIPCFATGPPTRRNRLGDTILWSPFCLTVCPSEHQLGW
jgi:hypothetical protein